MVVLDGIVGAICRKFYLVSGNDPAPSCQAFSAGCWWEEGVGLFTDLRTSCQQCGGC